METDSEEFVIMENDDYAKKHMHNNDSPDNELKYSPDDIYDDKLMNGLILLTKNNFRNFRIARNLTANEVSSMCNIPFSSYSRLEDLSKGSSNINLLSVIKYSIALGIPIEEIVPLKVSKKSMSNGMRFEQLTRNADIKTINFLFVMCEKFLKYTDQI